MLSPPEPPLVATKRAPGPGANLAWSRSNWERTLEFELGTLHKAHAEARQELAASQAAVASLEARLSAAEKNEISTVTAHRTEVAELVRTGDKVEVTLQEGLAELQKTHAATRLQLAERTEEVSKFERRVAEVEEKLRALELSRDEALTRCAELS